MNSNKKMYLGDSKIHAICELYRAGSTINIIADMLKLAPYIVRYWVTKKGFIVTTNGSRTDQDQPNPLDKLTLKYFRQESRASMETGYGC